MIQIMVKGQIYHCRHCHKSYYYRGKVTGCEGADCCHGADIPLTPIEVWKEYKARRKRLGIELKEANDK